MNCRRALRRLRSRFILAGMATALIAGASCSGAATGDQATGATDRVTLAVPAPSELFHLPVILADRLGYYADEGLDVKVIAVQSGNEAVQALLSRDAHVASGYIGNVITMTAKGQPLRSFVSTMNSPGVVVAVSPATKRRITNVADLKGAVVGVSAPGSATHMFLNYLLHKHGLSANDVSLAGIGIAATAVAALEHGKVDAAVIADPSLAQLQRRSDGVTLLADTRTASGLVDVFGSENHVAMTLYARPKWLAEHEATARKLTTAVTRASRWARERNAREIADTMPAEFAGGDRPLYEATIASAKPMVSADGRLYAEAVEAARDFLAVSVPEAASPTLNLSDTYTNEFLPTGEPLVAPEP